MAWAYFDATNPLYDHKQTAIRKKPKWQPLSLDHIPTGRLVAKGRRKMVRTSTPCVPWNTFPHCFFFVTFMVSYIPILLMLCLLLFWFALWEPLIAFTLCSFCFLQQFLLYPSLAFGVHCFGVLCFMSSLMETNKKKSYGTICL